MKSHNPLDYSCRFCEAVPGKFCATPGRRRLKTDFHSTRIKAMLDELRPEPMIMSLCEAHTVVLRVDRPYVFRPMGTCTKCAEMAEKAREAYGPTMGALA